MHNPPTDADLLAYSGEHLIHELSMLWEIPSALSKHKQGGTEYTALIESFATHLRNLIEFFYFTKKSGYVRAEDFVDDPDQWPAKTKLTPDLKDALQRANEEVAHLTTGRKNGSPPDKLWYMRENLKAIDSVAKEFALKASQNKLDPSVRGFLNLPPEKKLVWIADYVRHPNVAVTGPIVVPGPSSVNAASTATQIIIKLPFK